MERYAQLILRARSLQDMRIRIINAIQATDNVEERKVLIRAKNEVTAKIRLIKVALRKW